MKKVLSFIAVVAFVGVIALSSCKSGAATNADSDSAKVETPAPATPDTVKADTAKTDSAVVK